VKEYLLYISTNFSRCFKECEAVLLSQLPSTLSLDYFVLSIAFIRYEHFSYVLISMLIYLLQPIGNIVKGLLVSTVVYQYDTHRTLIIGLGYCTETLLSCSVPDL
jgi:hypothetical protein